MVSYLSSHAANLSLFPHLTAPSNRVQRLAKELAMIAGASFTLLSKPRHTAHNLPTRLVELLQSYLRLGHPIPSFTALLGIVDDGAPLLVRLPSPVVGHIHILGTLGSGKTTLAQTIILSLALSHRRSQLMFVLIDPKQRALGHLGQLAHLLWPVIQNVNDALDALDELVRLVETRERTQTRAPRIVVVIDETDPLLQIAGDHVPQALARLTQRGRWAGIHVIACAQKPPITITSSEALAQTAFPVRLVGKVGNSDEAYAATGLAESGAEKLKGRGDFIGIAQGALWRFQAAFATPAEGRQLVEQLNNGMRSWNLVSH